MPCYENKQNTDKLPYCLIFKFKNVYRLPFFDQGITKDGKSNSSRWEDRKTESPKDGKSNFSRRKDRKTESPKDGKTEIAIPAGGKTERPRVRKTEDERWKEQFQ